MVKEIRFSKDQDYSHTHAIELEGFEKIATAEDSGYLLLSRAENCIDYGLFHFSRQQEDMDITLRDLNMPVA